MAGGLADTIYRRTTKPGVPPRHPAKLRSLSGGGRERTLRSVERIRTKGRQAPLVKVTPDRKGQVSSQAAIQAFVRYFEIRENLVAPVRTARATCLSECRFFNRSSPAQVCPILDVYLPASTTYRRRWNQASFGISTPRAVNSGAHCRFAVSGRC